MIVIPCAERQKLLDDYLSAANEYTRTIEVLTKRLGVLSAAEYRAIRETSERMRLRKQNAKQKLHDHVSTHGCGF